MPDSPRQIIDRNKYCGKSKYMINPPFGARNIQGWNVIVNDDKQRNTQHQYNKHQQNHLQNMQAPLRVDCICLWFGHKTKISIDC